MPCGVSISNSIVDNKTGEILTDKTKAGKERPWQKHKVQSSKLAESYRRLDWIGKAERVEECASTLRFVTCPEGHEKRLQWANFCRVRLCSMCSWRRSLLVSHQVRLVTHEANQRENLRWLFLTLTVKNVDAVDLSSELTRLMQAWRRFSRRKVFRDNVVGWFRALEVTRNNDKKSDWYNSYHPHFHVLIAVRPSYFKGGRYISQKKWTSLWQQSLQVDYTPIVNVKAVKARRNRLRELEILEEKKQAAQVEHAVAEVAKYPLKSTSYLLPSEKATDEAVSTLDNALHRRRLLAYGGLLKETWNELQAVEKVQDAEEESSDLIHVDDTPDTCECSTCGSDMLEELYMWHIGVRNYVG